MNIAKNEKLGKKKKDILVEKKSLDEKADRERRIILRWRRWRQINWNTVTHLG